MVAILFEQLAIEPGERVILHNVDWPRFEALENCEKLSAAAIRLM
jgi:hypothetical protein